MWKHGSMKTEHIIVTIALLLFVGSVFYTAMAGVNNPSQVNAVGTSTPWDGADLAIELLRGNTPFVVADAGTSSPLFILNAKGFAGFGTTTPGAPFAITASSSFIFSSGNAGTTTFAIRNEAAANGNNACIELQTDGITYRVFINAARTGLLAEAGTCDN